MPSLSRRFQAVWCKRAGLCPAVSHAQTARRTQRTELRSSVDHAHHIHRGQVGITCPPSRLDGVSSCESTVFLFRSAVCLRRRHRKFVRQGFIRNGWRMFFLNRYSVRYFVSCVCMQCYQPCAIKKTDWIHVSCTSFSTFEICGKLNRLSCKRFLNSKHESECKKTKMTRLNRIFKLCYHYLFWFRHALWFCEIADRTIKELKMRRWSN